MGDKLYAVIDRLSLIIYAFKSVGRIGELSKIRILVYVCLPIRFLPGNDPDLMGGRDHFGEPLCQEGDLNFSIF